MKILVTSDLHGNLNGLDPFINQAEVICFAGDIAKLSGHTIWHIYDQKKWVEKKLFKLTAEYPDKQFVFTPGNHDFFPIAKQKFRTQNDLNWDLDFPENCHMLIDEGVEIAGKKFYGTPWVPPISYHWAFEADYELQCEKFSKIPSGLDVLLTHTPPHLFANETIDRSLQFGMSQAFGSHQLAKAIFNQKPKYAFCGHIHTGNHQPIRFEDTICQNVSRLDEKYEIAYDPIVVDI